MKDRRTFLACLGGLLHDIGIIANRGGIPLAKNYLNLNEKNNPWGDEAHAKWSSDFINQTYTSIFQHLLSQIVLFHHNPILIDDPDLRLITKIIQAADWLSSPEELNHEEKKNYNLNKTPLISIFSQLQLKKRKNLLYTQKGWLNNEVFLRKSEIIPKRVERKEKFSFSQSFVVNYKYLHQCLVKEINAINNTLSSEEEYFNNLIYIEELLCILEKYCSTSPQVTYLDSPDISLFDHLKTTGSIALCLSRIIKNEAEIDNLHEIILKNNISKDIMLLIHGDLSGIQKFIYTIKSKYALKSLKGRSAFLSILTKQLAENILNELELPLANLLFASGGNFYLLCSISDEEKVKKLTTVLTEKLLHIFDGDLYLAISSQRISTQDLVTGNVGKIWDQLIEKASIQKSRKFSDPSLINSYEKLFNPKIITKKMTNCFVCNRKVPSDNMKKIEDEYWCSLCISLVDLGKKHKSARFISKYLSNEKMSLNSYTMDYNDIFNAFGAKITLLKEKDPKATRNLSLNDERYIPYQYFPMGLPLSKKDDHIADLDELVIKNSKKTLNDPHNELDKLAILKMDIDDLGLLFSQGLETNQTFSRIVTLSRMISFFFEGYINTILESESHNFKDKVYLVYSGGDDTLLLGRWDKVLELSYIIYQAFRNFTCNNPHVTISTAVVIVNPKFPISRAVELVSKNLEHCKELDENKNRFSLFGIPFTWDLFQIDKSQQNIINYINSLSIKDFDYFCEFAVIYYLKEILYEMIHNYGCPRSILFKIDSTIQGLIPILKQSSIGHFNIPRVWRLRYFLRKYGKNDKNIERGINAIIHLYELMIENNLIQSPKGDQRFLLNKANMIRVAIKWADLLTRCQ